MQRPTYFSFKSLVLLIAIAIVIPLTGCETGGEPTQQTGTYERLDFQAVLDAPRFGGGQPTPSGIMWLPDGNSFLYRISEGEGEEAATMLYRYDAASGEKTEVANWNDVQARLREMSPARPSAAMNDVNTAARVSYTQMDLSPDGTLLLGSYNSDLFTYNLMTGEIRFLTNDAGLEIWPSFSPDGGKVAFAKDKDIYWLNLANNRVTRLTRRENELIYNGVPDWVYDEEFALRRAFWWAPTSDRIAFLQFDTSPITTFPIVDNLPRIPTVEQQQYPEAGDPNAIVRAGVVDIASGGLTWIDTGRGTDSYIARVGWLPDGSRVWLQWVDRDQTTIDLLFANPQTGSTNLILQEKDEAWVEMRDDFRFIDERRFIWTSERSGWRHIYVYGIDGVLERQLTDGEWQVENIGGFDSDRNYIYFTATEAGPLERQIYRVGIDGEGFERLSEGEGWHRLNMADVGDFYIASFNNPTTPTRAAIHNADGEELRSFYETTNEMVERYGQALPEYFTIKAEDGTDLWAYMIKPRDFDPNKKYPVLVSIYGGPDSQAVVKRFMYSAYNQFLIQEGIIYFRIDNRGTGARGHDFLRSMYRRLGYWELKDHVTGVEYLKTLPYIDGERIAIMGGSYGGYMTLNAMFKAPEHFQYGISLYPVTDWRFYDTIYTERYMDRPRDNPEGYQESSTLPFAGNLQGKLLIIHGAMDNNVHYANTTAVTEELFKAGKQFELMVYPRERHGIRAPQHRRHSNILTARFLTKHLLGKELDYEEEK